MVISHGPAFPGQGPEKVQDQAADGVELLRGQLQPQGLIEIRQRHGGLDPPEPRGDLLQGLLFHLKLLGNLAAEFLQQVLDAHQPHQGAVFVHHQGQAQMLGLQLRQQVKGLLVFRHVIDGPQDIFQHPVLAQVL